MIKNLTKKLQLICIVLLFCTQAQSQHVVKRIATGFGFTEGPLWIDNVGLIFSNIPGNAVILYDTASQQTSTYYSPSGNSNGLALDADGNLLLVQHGKRALSVVVDKNEISLADTFNGKKINSPNDLAVKSDGSIYFTDPNYGIQPGQEELGFYGVYKYSDGQLSLIDSSFDLPNGIAFSPDETLLYVSESKTPGIYVFDVEEDTIVNKRLLYNLGTGPGDGIKVDSNGNIYSAGPGGVHIISPEGQLLDTISIPERVTNLAFGNYDRKTLYVTTPTSVYSVTNALITSTVEAINSSDKLINSAYFDQSNNTVVVNLNSKQMTEAKIELRALNGNLTDVLYNGQISAGVKDIRKQTNTLAEGMYLVHITTPQKSAVYKISCVK